jgi:hypothetical protein
MPTAICRICNEEKDFSAFNIVNGRVRKYICYPCRGKRERAQFKLGMLEAFGWKCECCGETNPQFLTLDHKNPGEGEKSTGLKTHQLYAIAKADEWNRSKYQLLCFNCNCAKGHFGECPHKLGKSAEEIVEELKRAARSIVREYGPLTEAQKEALKLGPLSQRKSSNGSNASLSTNAPQTGQSPCHAPHLRT